MHPSSVEIEFTAEAAYPEPYTDVDLYVDLSDSGGQTFQRPAFWDGGDVWRVRVASPSAGTWTWRSVCSRATDNGLHDRRGTFDSVHTGDFSLHGRDGLLKMSPGRRNVIRADGSPYLLVGDTAWSLPWRATPRQVTEYAADRQSKGFNCALLMTIQPDQDARGPRSRHSPGGFDVGFEDLPSGHINRLNAGYFQEMDGLMNILLVHGIVPIYQPVFQGYGWKGLRALGQTVDPAEYARYCRYLVARYGAWPAIWLVSADNNGMAPCVEAGGKEIYRWDAYHQPLGIHYSAADSVHRNRSHQGAEWLDFQWCQTGHDGQDSDKVSWMVDAMPAKGVANGEPTYEGIGEPGNAAGWWQGNAAWKNLTSGGTMGVFYGVAALWQWKLTADEPGWPAWARDNCSWKDALALPGSTCVGCVGKALEGFDYLDMAPHPELAGGKGCVAKPGVFYCIYLPDGGEVKLKGVTSGLPWYWFNARSGEVLHGGSTDSTEFKVSAPDEQPWVLAVGKKRKTKENS